MELFGGFGATISSAPLISPLSAAAPPRFPQASLTWQLFLGFQIPFYLSQYSSLNLQTIYLLTLGITYSVAIEKDEGALIFISTTCSSSIQMIGVDKSSSMSLSFRMLSLMLKCHTLDLAIKFISSLIQRRR